MEWFLSLFIFHDAYVVSSLVLAIAIVVVLLLIFNQQSPRAIVADEMEGSTERIEGLLKRVLKESKTVEENDGEQDSLEMLKKEVLDKDRTIAELNKKLNQGTASSSAAGGAVPAVDTSELEQKIAELEAQLEEYELIEDDIADLSNYRSENTKLKEEIARLKGIQGEEAESTAPSTEPAQEPPQSLGSDDSASDDAHHDPDQNTEGDSDDSDDSRESQVVTMAKGDSPDREESHAIEADESLDKSDNLDVQKSAQEDSSSEPEATEDLLSEFEKVVSQQESMQQDEIGESPITHPKLEKVPPDSKEEAEVFISELKSLKKGS
jgi:thiamine phosphate synthase YjbQ (UPF0047 family)